MAHEAVERHISATQSPEPIRGGVYSKALELTRELERNDPLKRRDIMWQMATVAGVPTVSLRWRSQPNTEVAKVRGVSTDGVEGTDTIFPDPSEPAVSKVITQTLVEATRKRLATGFPKS